MIVGNWTRYVLISIHLCKEYAQSTNNRWNIYQTIPWNILPSDSNCVPQTRCAFQKYNRHWAHGLTVFGGWQSCNHASCWISPYLFVRKRSRTFWYLTLKTNIFTCDKINWNFLYLPTRILSWSWWKHLDLRKPEYSIIRGQTRKQHHQAGKLQIQEKKKTDAKMSATKFNSQSEGLIKWNQQV